MTEQSDGLVRRRLFDLEFVDAASIAEVADVLLRPTAAVDAVARGLLPVVVTPNVDHLVLLDSDELVPRAVDVMSSAAWVLPDGQPIVWTSRLVHRPLAERLPGSGLVEHLWPALCSAGRPSLVVAPNAETAELIRRDDPRSVVLLAPMLGAGDAEADAAVAAFARECVVALPADGVGFVFVALGFPVQCLVAAALLDAWPPQMDPPVVLCIGASFEMLHGLKRRAPRWVQRAGLEWVFRLVQEPRRLFRRYLLRDPKFVLLLWREWRHRHTST